MTEALALHGLILGGFFLALAAIDTVLEWIARRQETLR